MTSSQKNVDFLIEQMAGAGTVSAKKMFGEYAIYCGDKLVALFCDDQLYVKPTDQGKAFAGTLSEAAPYPGAKPCLLIDGEKLGYHEWLAQFVRITAANLPAPKKKAPKLL